VRDCDPAVDDLDLLSCDGKAGTGHASPKPTAPSSVRKITTTFGEVNRSVVPKRRVDGNDAARGITSTDWIFI
jgi:hypothetical protein